METCSLRVVILGEVGKSNELTDTDHAVSEVIDKCEAVVENWVEKDYGLVIYCKVPECFMPLARAGFGNIHGVTYSE